MFRTIDAMPAETRFTVTLAGPQDWPVVIAALGQLADVYQTPLAWQWQCPQPGPLPGHEAVDAATFVHSHCALAHGEGGELLALVFGQVQRAWVNGEVQAVFVVGLRLCRSRTRLGLPVEGEALLNACEAHVWRALAGRVALVIAWHAVGWPGCSVHVAPTGGDQRLIALPWQQCAITAMEDPPGGTCVAKPTVFAEPGWDSLWEQRRAALPAALVRDQRALAWRYGGPAAITRKAPWCFGFWSAASRTPLGYVVLQSQVQERGVAVLLDAVFPTQNQMLRDGMRQVADFLVGRGIDRIRTAFSKDAPEARCLPGLGFNAVPLADQTEVTCWLGPTQPGSPAHWSLSLADVPVYSAANFAQPV